MRNLIPLGACSCCAPSSRCSFSFCTGSARTSPSLSFWFDFVFFICSDVLIYFCISPVMSLVCCIGVLVSMPWLFGFRSSNLVFVIQRTPFGLYDPFSNVCLLVTRGLVYVPGKIALLWILKCDVVGLWLPFLSRVPQICLRCIRLFACRSRRLVGGLFGLLPIPLFPMSWNDNLRTSRALDDFNGQSSRVPSTTRERQT